MLYIAKTAVKKIIQNCLAKNTRHAYVTTWLRNNALYRHVKGGAIIFEQVRSNRGYSFVLMYYNVPGRN